MVSPERTTMSRSARFVGLPECPIFIDMRTDDVSEDDSRMIPGARRDDVTQ